MQKHIQRSTTISARDKIYNYCKRKKYSNLPSGIIVFIPNNTWPPAINPYVYLSRTIFVLNYKHL